MSQPPALILASTSRYRRALLTRLGVPFDVEAPGVDEAPAAHELPMDRALRLALAKAQAVAARHPQAFVIGSDQVAATAQGLVHKPGNAERCRAQLAHLSGGTARFYTAGALVGPQLRLSHLDTTTVTFRTLSETEIARYVARDEPYDCAGGFKTESLGIALMESIESCDPTALIGLPLIWLSDALRSAGYALP